MSARKSLILSLALSVISIVASVACAWYASVPYMYNGQTWRLFCGKRTPTSSVQVLGACLADTLDANGKPACSNNPNTMGTWVQYDYMYNPATKCALTLSDPPQPTDPPLCSPGGFRLWSFSGAFGIGQGQRGPVPPGGLPSCPNP